MVDRYAYMSRPNILRLLFTIVCLFVLYVVVGFLSFFALVNPAPSATSRSIAIEQAASEAGFKWPGTTVAVTSIADDEVEVRREWLGITEAVSIISQEGNRWQLGASPTHGPADIVQFMLLAVLPSVVILWWSLRGILRGPKKGS